MPDPADYVDDFAQKSEEFVTWWDGWKAEPDRRDAVNRMPVEFIVKIGDDMSELVRVQGQVNAMMLAALDELRAHDTG